MSAKNVDYNTEVFNDFVKYFTCTEEDINRQVTDDELKELCLRKKCRVRMSRWNPVDDFKHRLRRSGRLKNKTPKEINKFLAKCVNHYKSTALYSEEEKEEARLEEWRQTKKNNLLLLDFLEYNRKKELSELKEKEHEEQPNAIFSLSEPENNTNNTVLNDFIDVNTESLCLLSQDVATQSQDIDKQLLALDSLTLSEDINYCTEEIVFTEGSEYDRFHTSVPCTSTQEFHKANH